MSYKTVMSVLAAVVVGATVTEAAPRHRLGAGVHYWRTIDDIDVDDVDESGFAPVFSYQYRPATLFRFGVELEVLPKHFGGADTQVYAPAGYVFLGPRLIYAGLGIGTYYVDGDASKPFYNLRAGVEIPIFIRTRLDINANYRFNSLDDIEDVDEHIDTDTVTLGAAIRIDI